MNKTHVRNSSGERLYLDSKGVKCNILGMIRREPEWVAHRFEQMMDDAETDHLARIAKALEWIASHTYGERTNSAGCRFQSGEVTSNA